MEALRAAGHGTEKIYYIRYRKQGKLIEEKVGGQYRDNMTAAKAASIRGLRIEGKDASNGEKRTAARAARQTEESRYSFNRIWALFKESGTPYALDGWAMEIIRAALGRHVRKTPGAGKAR